MNALIESYKSPNWSFTVQVLNLASTGSAAWDTKSRFINDILCASSELPTCTTGSPTLQSVMEWVTKTEKISNGLAKVVKLGYSRMNNPIVALEFEASPKIPKPTIWFDGVIHGNEPIGQVVIQDIAAELLDKSNLVTRAWLAKYRFVLIPVLNPDGLLLSTTRYARRVKPVGAISFHSNAHFAVFPFAAVGSADEGFFRKLITEIGKSMRDEKGASGTQIRADVACAGGACKSCGRYMARHRKVCGNY